MNFKQISIWTAGILLFVLLSGMTVSSQSLRRPTPLDLKGPLTKIAEKLELTIEKFNLGLFLFKIVEILVDCLPTGGGKWNGKTSDEILTEFQKQIELLNLPETTPLFPGLTPRSFSEYCKTPDFATIHNFVWVEESQLEDVVHFFSQAGFPEAYTSIREFYEVNNCPQDLIDTLPTGPATQKRAHKSANPKLMKLLLHRNSSEVYGPANPLVKCDILSIITEIQATGVFELLDLIGTLIKEFRTKASLHFMVGMVQEPVKGVSFRQLRLLTPVRQLLYEAHQSVINDPILSAILKVIKALTGIDLIENNLFEALVSLVELVVWLNDTDVPPYIPPPMMI